MIYECIIYNFLPKALTENVILKVTASVVYVDAITNPCINFNGGLTEPPVKIMDE